MYNILLHNFISYACPGCRINRLEPNSSFCPSCVDKLNLIKYSECKSCGGILDTILNVCSKCLKNEDTHWKTAVSLFEMKQFGRDIIQRLKYQNDTSLVRPLAALSSRHFEEKYKDIDLITYVPMHWIKYLKRGYNQSALIAKQIAFNNNIQFKRTLFRNKNTQSQTKLSAEIRRKNLVGVFGILKKVDIENKNILVVDDVFTTGSTLCSVTNELFKGKPASVSILVMARR